MPDHEIDPSPYFDTLKEETVSERLSPREVRRIAGRRRTVRATIAGVASIAVLAAGTIAVVQNWGQGDRGIPARPEVTASAPATTTPPPVTPTQTPAPTQPSTQASASPSRTAMIEPGDVLTTAGLGQLTLGMPVSVLVDAGWAVPSQICEKTWDASPRLMAEGVRFRNYGQGTIGQIMLATSKHSTLSGASVGMSVGDVKQIYGTRGRVEAKDGVGGKFEVYTVVADGHEIAFIGNFDKVTMSDTDTVTFVVLQPYTTFLGWDGC